MGLRGSKQDFNFCDGTKILSQNRHTLSPRSRIEMLRVLVNDKAHMPICGPSEAGCAMVASEG